jgi:hypothetical protein
MPTMPTDQQLLCAWLSAHYALASGAVSYSIFGRSLTKTDSAEIRNNIVFYENRVAATTGIGIGGTTLLASFNQ